MQDLIDALKLAKAEVLKPGLVRKALFIGTLITFLWSIVTWLLWQPLFDVSSWLLELLPFSLLRTNGASMLSLFLWFDMVLMGFALIYAFFAPYLMRRFSFKNYFTLSVIVMLMSALFWSTVWFFKADAIHMMLVQLLTWLPFETIEKGLAALVVLYACYSTIIVSLIFAVSLMSPSMLKKAHDTHYAEDEPAQVHELNVLKYTLKDSGRFIAASIVLFPLLFIPVINVFLQIGLWVWLIKDTFVYDNLVLLDESIDKTDLKPYNGELFLIAVLAALFNFIPIVNFLAPFFGEFAMLFFLQSQKSSLEV